MSAFMPRMESESSSSCIWKCSHFALSLSRTATHSRALSFKLSEAELILLSTSRTRARMPSKDAACSRKSSMETSLARIWSSIERRDAVKDATSRRKPSAAVTPVRRGSMSAFMPRMESESSSSCIWKCSHFALSLSRTATHSRALSFKLSEAELILLSTSRTRARMPSKDATSLRTPIITSDNSANRMLCISACWRMASRSADDSRAMERKSSSAEIKRCRRETTSPVSSSISGRPPMGRSSCMDCNESESNSKRACVSRTIAQTVLCSSARPCALAVDRSSTVASSMRSASMLRLNSPRSASSSDGEVSCRRSSTALRSDSDLDSAARRASPCCCCTQWSRSRRTSNALSELRTALMSL